MNDPPPNRLRITGQLGQVWLESALTELAESVEAWPAQAGVLLEESSSDPDALSIFPGDADLAEALRLRFRAASQGAAVFAAGVGPAEESSPRIHSVVRVEPAASAGYHRTGAFSLPLGGPANPPSLFPRLPLLSETERLEGEACLRTYWFPAGGRGIHSYLRLGLGSDASERAVTPVFHRLSRIGFPLLSCRPFQLSEKGLRTWAARGLSPSWRDRGFHLTTGLAARAVLPVGDLFGAAPDEPLRQTVIFGASGAGKTTTLVARGLEAMRAGTPVLLLDLHGDIGPRLVSALPPGPRERVVAIDAGRPELGLPGVPVLGASSDGAREAEAAHLVAALKRLTPDGSETYWGFRLERLFDAFIRIVQHEGGTLLDLYALLTDGRRREAARFTAPTPELRRFLEEIPALIRRNPEFLWPAATRLSKVVLVPALAALLAPRRNPVDPVRLIAEGKSLLIRLPIGELGPEGASVAATLLLTRAYLDLVRSVPSNPGVDPRAFFILDEAHLFPPRLVTEILSEGRKFGIATLLATQFPERLATDVRAAAAGAVGTVLLFRIPFANAIRAGEWTGLTPMEAAKWLPALPPGVAVEAVSGAGMRRRLVGVGPHLDVDPAAWTELVRKTSSVYAAGVPIVGASDEPNTEAWLLASLGLNERDERADFPRILEAALEIAGSSIIDPVTARSELDALVRRGWLEEKEGTWQLTGAGERRIGLTPETGAEKETHEHRWLILTAFRIFARHGYRLEIVHQGSFDRRLPDARLELIGPSLRRLSPTGLEHELRRLRGGWAWKIFGGRDVFVEAEVSHATRKDQIVRGIEKGAAADAFVLFLVTRPDRARKIRAILELQGVGRGRAGVWTISPRQF